VYYPFRKEAFTLDIFSVSETEKHPCIASSRFHLAKPFCPTSFRNGLVVSGDTMITWLNEFIVWVDEEITESNACFSS
jgi:hypothetical protein